MGGCVIQPKCFISWSPEQMLLPSPVDLLPGILLVFVLLDLAVELDLEEIYSVNWQKNLCEEKAYDTRMLVVLIL
jgi:hypothetical protein